jgi:hypothetical protein
MPSKTLREDFERWGYSKIASKIQGGSFTQLNFDRLGGER